MDSETRANFENVYELLGEILERVELVLVGDGIPEPRSKENILEEIAKSQEHIRQAVTQLKASAPTS